MSFWTQMTRVGLHVDGRGDEPVERQRLQDRSAQVGVGAPVLVTTPCAAETATARLSIFGSQRSSSWASLRS
jgi:hypothetical protein